MEVKIKALSQVINKDSGKYLIQTFIPFKELRERVIYTFRKQLGYDIYSENEYNRNDYQRQLDKTHLKDIRKYILQWYRSKKDMPLFPTPLLLASNENVEYESNDGVIDWNISESFYVIDGQHRLMAMQELYDSVATYPEIKEAIGKYKFNCLVYVNFDIWEQSVIFADVNFKQKKVNKSLYYDIYGTIFSEDNKDLPQNALYITHKLVEYLNEADGSPLKGCIKMLGNGEGTVSQACVVENLINNIVSPRGIWYPGPNNGIDKNLLSFIKSEVMGYLRVVSTILKKQWYSTDSIMKKTTGLSAILKLMGYIHKKMELNTSIFSNIGTLNQEKYIAELSKYIKLLEPSQEELFSSNKGKFSKTGGKGLQTSLYRALVALVSKYNG